MSLAKIIQIQNKKRSACHKKSPQTHTADHPRHHEEETQNTNSHITTGRELNQSNKLVLAQGVDYKTRRET